MKDNTDKEKFIELRGRGLSFAKISEKIGVSKPTLIKWNVELRKEISNHTYLAAEELLERYQLMKNARVHIFSKLLQKSLQELENRKFESMSNKELLSLVNLFETRLREEITSIHCIAETANCWTEPLEQTEVKMPLVD